MIYMYTSSYNEHTLQTSEKGVNTPTLWKQKTSILLQKLMPGGWYSIFICLYSPDETGIRRVRHWTVDKIPTLSKQKTSILPQKLMPEGWYSIYICLYSPDETGIRRVLDCRRNTNLIKTKNVNPATEVDARWTDTVYSRLLEARLGVHCPHCHGCW